MIGFFRRRQQLRCQQAVELITDYLEDALPAAQTRRLESHLAQCPHCAEYLAQIRTTIAVTGRVAPPDVDAADRRALLELYRSTIS